VVGDWIQCVDHDHCGDSHSGGPRSVRTTRHIIATETLRTGEHEMIQLTTVCPVTQQQSVVNVYGDEWREWMHPTQDLLIQQVFPHLDGDQLELILTGTTSQGWNLLFPDD